MSEIVIKDALLLTMEGDGGADPITADIRILDDLIDEVAPGLSPGPEAKVIDARDRLVMPGLVNAHLHSAEALLRGRYDCLPMETWSLFAYPMIGAPTIDQELVYLRTLIVAIESLKGGVTAVVDDAPETTMLDLDTLGTVFRAYEDSGIRASCSGAVIDRHIVEAIPFADRVLPESLQQQIRGIAFPTANDFVEFSRAAIAAHHGAARGRLRFFVSPINPLWCSDELLAATASLSREYDLMLHSHLLETRTQVLTAERMGADTIMRRLSNLGVLGSNSSFAHGVWVTEQDIQILADNCCSIVHNPISNLRLGSGIAPLRKLLNHGVNVALGTDGIASSDSARLFDVIRLAGLLHTVTSDDFQTWPQASEIIAASTLGGARSACLDDVGGLSAGNKADLTVLRLDTIPYTPLNDPVKHLVYSDNGQSVDVVIVDGEIVVEGGEVKTVNEDEVRTEIAARFSSFISQHERAERLQRQFDPYLREMYRLLAAGQ